MSEQGKPQPWMKDAAREGYLLFNEWTKKLLRFSDVPPASDLENGLAQIISDYAASQPPTLESLDELVTRLYSQVGLATDSERTLFEDVIREAYNIGFRSASQPLVPPPNIYDDAFKLIGLLRSVIACGEKLNKDDDVEIVRVLDALRLARNGEPLVPQQEPTEQDIKPHSSVIYTDLRIRCRCGEALIWRYLEDKDEVEVFHCAEPKAGVPSEQGTPPQGTCDYDTGLHPKDRPVLDAPDIHSTCKNWKPVASQGTGWVSVEDLKDLRGYFSHRAVENDRRSNKLEVGSTERNWHIGKHDTYKRCAEKLDEVIRAAEALPTPPSGEKT